MNLFGPPNIKKLTEKHDVKGLIKALANKSSSIQYEVIRAIENLKDLEFVEPLLQIAFSNNANWEYAFRALRSIKDPRMVDPLLQLLNEIRKQSKLNIVEGKFYDIHFNIIETLAEIEDSRIIPEMIAIVKSDREQKLSKLAEIALIKIGDKSVLPLTQNLADSYNKEKIITIIAEIGTPNALNQLELIVESNNKIIRETAAKYLLKNNIKPRLQKSFIYYSIAIKDFNSVFKEGEISIPILNNVLKEEINPTDKSFRKDDWEMVAMMAATLIKLGVQSSELENVLKNALDKSKDLNIRKIIINIILELGQDYESMLISYVDSYLKRSNDKEIDAGKLLGFPKHIYLKLFSRDNTLISKTQYLCVLSRFDAYNTSNDMRVKILNAQNLLIEIGYPLIEYIREKIEQKSDLDSLSQEFDTLLHIGRLDKIICAEEQNLLELLNKERKR
jgi:hypothetical protein